MNRIFVKIERFFSMLYRFSETKGFAVGITLILILVSAAILAFLINQAIAPRIENLFKVAFALPKSKANQFSFGFSLSISVLAYIVLGIRGTRQLFGKVKTIENNEIKVKVKEIGKYDMYWLGGSIIFIEVASLVVLMIESKKIWELLLGGLAFQVFLAIILKVTMPMAKYSEDTASENVEKEMEMGHKLESEKSLSALQPTQTASKPLTSSATGTTFEVKKSKIA